MIKPKGLEKGDLIGIVAPASPLQGKQLDQAIEKFKAMGFRIEVGESCYSKDRYLAGDDSIRVKDINNYFSNKEIKGIVSLRGGYGSQRLLKNIDFDMIMKNPKIFIGYSDITAIHIAINQLSRLITFHGPMALNIPHMDEFTASSLLNTIMINKGSYEINNPPFYEIHTLRRGIASGILTGGNLSMIVSTLGTPYEIETKGRILFVEDIKEEGYKIDRMLTQLSLAGKLEEVAGIIIGNFKDCCYQEDHKDVPLYKLFKEKLPHNIPILYNLMAGHCKPNITLPLGARTTINAEEGKILIQESVLDEV
ncbi:S66 peptidase family protein [Alkaliphilus serpentinus]|uniref:LD-carboxypeptidase n=1 Tax=Alkaliphilus serpentinus TaxID=1482731 RepID=A0A833HMN3_9FIRM|nr:LD-carboxypeptidase [Alkaliphilus serpentinus]KAB3528821.1 LD-carboxypeptidase [Alkaliphilus serpentinus]